MERGRHRGGEGRELVGGNGARIEHDAVGGDAGDDRRVVLPQARGQGVGRQLPRIHAHEPPPELDPPEPPPTPPRCTLPDLPTPPPPPLHAPPPPPNPPTVLPHHPTP